MKRSIDSNKYKLRLFYISEASKRENLMMEIVDEDNIGYYVMS